MLLEFHIVTATTGGPATAHPLVRYGMVLLKEEPTRFLFAKSINTQCTGIYFIALGQPLGNWNWDRKMSSFSWWPALAPSTVTFIGV